MVSPENNPDRTVRPTPTTPPNVEITSEPFEVSD